MSRSDQNKAMHEYLDALLFDDIAPAAEAKPVIEKPEQNTKELERLLAQANAANLQQEKEEAAQLEAEFARAAQLEREQEAKQQAIMKTKALADVDKASEQSAAAETSSLNTALVNIPPPPVSNMQDYQEGNFQALFFSVAGLKLAVPLKSLGGIHQWKEPNTIFGKPAWYLGIMTNREEKLNIVDTARWVMPEKYTPQMAEALDYKYLVMLGESQWGLACESLVTTQSLSPDDIQWRKNTAGKRPWLAGVVREKMCAILDVDAMVDMLDQGLNSRD